jgi:hypothetical protein
MSCRSTGMLQDLMFSFMLRVYQSVSMPLEFLHPLSGYKNLWKDTGAFRFSFVCYCTMHTSGWGGYWPLVLVGITCSLSFCFRGEARTDMWITWRFLANSSVICVLTYFSPCDLRAQSVQYRDPLVFIHSAAFSCNTATQRLVASECHIFLLHLSVKFLLFVFPKDW